MTSMKNVFVLLADGFEEMEAVIPVDLLRRAGITVKTISMSDNKKITGSRGIVIEADLCISSVLDESMTIDMPDAILLPGGLNGSINLSKHQSTEKLLRTILSNDRLVVVLCAAPIIVLAPLGLLDGRKFTCYPGMEKEDKYIKDADVQGYCTEKVVVDGNLITSQGPGTSAECIFTLIELLVGKETADNVKKAALF